MSSTPGRGAGRLGDSLMAGLSVEQGWTAVDGYAAGEAADRDDRAYLHAQSLQPGIQRRGMERAGNGVEHIVAVNAEDDALIETLERALDGERHDGDIERRRVGERRRNDEGRQIRRPVFRRDERQQRHDLRRLITDQPTPPRPLGGARDEA